MIKFLLSILMLLFFGALAILLEHLYWKYIRKVYPFQYYIPISRYKKLHRKAFIEGMKTEYYLRLKVSTYLRELCEDYPE